MTIRTTARVTTRVRPASGKAIWGAAGLMAMFLVLLLLRLDFARYAFTAFAWERAEGTVRSPHWTTDPTVEFVARDGSLHTFSEDYWLLCHRSLCFTRSFTPGQIVPVVYDPATPQRALVRDFALYSTIFEWFVEAFFFVLFALLMFAMLRGRSSSVAIRFGSDPNRE